MRLTTSEFTDGAAIPRRFTCDGEDVSPALAIESVPDGAASLALVMDDPDAPHGTFVHWLMWNLPPDTRVIPEAVPAEKHVRELGEANQGTTDFGRVGYGGPCPPRGTHTYRLFLYALDARLDLKAGARRDALDDAMRPHILAQATLRGTYAR